MKNLHFCASVWISVPNPAFCVSVEQVILYLSSCWLGSWALSEVPHVGVAILTIVNDDTEWLRLLICKTWNKNILGFSLITSKPRQVTDAWRRQGSLGCLPPSPPEAALPLCLQMRSCLSHTLFSSWCLFMAGTIIISVESQKVTLSVWSPKTAGVAGWQQ